MLTSPDEGLSVPMKPMRSIGQKAVNQAKPIPVSAMRMDAARNNRCKPMRLNRKPTERVIPADPSKVTVVRTPMRRASNPSANK